MHPPDDVEEATLAQLAESIPVPSSAMMTTITTPAQISRTNIASTSYGPGTSGGHAPGGPTGSPGGGGPSGGGESQQVHN